MVRGFLPFVLALIGLPMIFIASINPLFEWKISEIVTEVPSSYEINVSPSPWITIIGDALNDKAYVFTKISVLNDGQFCSSKDFSVIVRRSQKDDLLERLSLWRQFNSRGIDWPIWWILAVIALSMVYLLWFTYWRDHRTIAYTILSGVFATTAFCFVIIPMMKLMGPRIGYLFGGIASCQGVITFSAELVKVYYSVPLVLLAGVFAELAAIIMMAHEVVKVARNRTESSKLAVG